MRPIYFYDFYVKTIKLLPLCWKECHAIHVFLLWCYSCSWNEELTDKNVYGCNINMSNPPLKCRMWVEWVYFHSEVELTVVWHEAGEDTQLDKMKQKRRRVIRGDWKQSFHFKNSKRRYRCSNGENPADVPDVCIVSSLSWGRTFLFLLMISVKRSLWWWCGIVVVWMNKS